MNDRQFQRARRRRIKQHRKRQRIERAVIGCVSVVFGIVLVMAIFKPQIAVSGNSKEHIDGSPIIYEGGIEQENPKKRASAVTTTEAPEPATLYTVQDVEALAKVVYGEAECTNSDTEMAAVIWCILNRVDSPNYPDSIYEVITQPYQFHGYNKNHPVMSRIQNLCLDVLGRYEREKHGEENVGRVLPKEYLYFEGDGKHNHFMTEYHGGTEWQFQSGSPYDN